jgi:hypothetical protein
MTKSRSTSQSRTVSPQAWGTSAKRGGILAPRARSGWNAAVAVAATDAPAVADEVACPVAVGEGTEPAGTEQAAKKRQLAITARIEAA